MDRRQFLSLAASTAGAAALPTARRVGTTDVTYLRAEVTRLWHLDEAAGGGNVYRQVTGQLADVRALLDDGRYGDSIGRDLQVIAGLLQELAGFTAYDAGRHPTARVHFHEALTTAQVAGDDDLAVYVLAQLANQSAWLGRGAETVEYADAALRYARRMPAPRLQALLLLRAAQGHGLRGDPAAAHMALARAEAEMTDAGDDQGVWFGYFTAPMFAETAGQVFLALGQPAAAERCARDAVSPELAARPRARNCVTHAHTLAAAGRVDEAAAAVVDAVTWGQGVASARMRSDLHSLRYALEPNASVEGVPAALAALDAL